MCDSRYFWNESVKEGLRDDEKLHWFKILKWLMCSYYFLFFKTLTPLASLSFWISFSWFLKANVPPSWVDLSVLRKSRDNEQDKEKEVYVRPPGVALNFVEARAFRGFRMYCLLGSQMVGNWIKIQTYKNLTSSSYQSNEKNRQYVFCFVFPEKLRLNGIP